MKKSSRWFWIVLVVMLLIAAVSNRVEITAMGVLQVVLLLVIIALSAGLVGALGYLFYLMVKP